MCTEYNCIISSFFPCDFCLLCRHVALVYCITRVIKTFLQYQPFTFLPNVVFFNSTKVNLLNARFTKSRREQEAASNLLQWAIQQKLVSCLAVHPDEPAETILIISNFMQQGKGREGKGREGKGREGKGSATNRFGKSTIT